MNVPASAVSSLTSRAQPRALALRLVTPLRAWRGGLMLLAALLFAGHALADTPAAPTFAGGNGTQGDPFQISNLAELRKFMEIGQIFPNNAWYKLTANIEASDMSTWLGGLGWQPVDATLLDGFDPAGFEIQNLYINRPTENDVGFFKSAGAFCCQTLANFKLVGGQVTGQDNVGALIGNGANGVSISNSSSSVVVSGRSTVGGLAGYFGNQSITGSSTSGTVTGSANIVGGLVGNAGGTSISSSHATGHVTGKREVGGLVGVFTQSSGTGITTSWASGQVDGDDLVGGLVGNSNGKVAFSFATGVVTATGVNPVIPGFALTGGLIGQQALGRQTEDSWASGNVTGSLSGIGGLIGSNAGPVLRCVTLAGQTVLGGANAGSIGGLVGDNKGTITASRSASTVEATGTVMAIGGLVGESATGSNITNSYATGSVTGPNVTRIGGLIGSHDAGIINGSHAHGNVFGLDDVGGLIGFSTTAAVNTSHATGTVSGRNQVGGLIGNRGTGTTDTTFATGTVTGSANFVAGLIGRNNGAVQKSYARNGAVNGQDWVGGLIGYNTKTVVTSFAVKSVSGVNRVGGLIGESASASFGIQDCYAQGTVSGSDKTGGLVGLNAGGSNIVKCYASGTVTPTGAGSVGGLAGDNQSGSNANDYWNTTTGPAAGIGTGFTTGVTGLTSVQMKQQASFSGFVFGAMPWSINEGVTEPFLDYATAGVSSTTTALVSNANPSALGQSVTFIATVTGNNASGTALFQEGNTPISGCVAVTVTAGAAQCTISSFALGTHTVSAVYSGDGLNTGSTSPTVNQLVVPLSLDVDASTGAPRYDALTDGLLIVRYLNGMTGNALVAGALGQTAVRIDPVQIKNYLDYIRPQLDIDGDGNADAATDGLLIVRYLSGLRGAALIADAVALPEATRQTAMDIEMWLQALLPP